MRALVISAAALLVSTSAFATPKPTPVSTFSPHNDVRQSMNQGQAQGQQQGQSATGVGTGIGYGGGGGGGGGGGAGGNATGGAGGSSYADQANRQTTTVNANTYQARQRLQAPGIAASFSSVAGSPCEGAPFGVGLSLPGLGGLLQIPTDRGNCWNERRVTQGLDLMRAGIPISPAAIAAIYAGVDANQAMRDNPYVGRAYVVRTHRAKRKPCRPCGQ